MPQLLALLLLAASFPAAADIYKWTDANGRVHFGDSAAGAGQPAAAMTTPTPGNTFGNDPASLERRDRQRRLDAAHRAETAERERQLREQAAARAKVEPQCERIRDSLRRMDGRAAYMLNDKGEQVFLDEEQRRQYTETAHKNLKEHCE